MWTPKGARCFYPSWHVAIWCVSVGKKRGWGGLTPPNTSTNKIIFTSLQCHSNNRIPEQNMVGIESRSCTYCSCTDVLFPPLHTHTPWWRVLLTLAGIPTPPRVPQGLVTPSLVLCALCDIPSTWRTGPIVCLRERDGAESIGRVHTGSC